MDLRTPVGATTRKKRLGRGPGSGTGCTAGKGTKGQKARSGKKIRPGFEGGQMPLYRRLPHRGFSNHPFKKEYTEISFTDITNKFASGDVITLPALHEKKLIAAEAKYVKILNNGVLEIPVSVSSEIAVSKSAKEKILSAGGQFIDDARTSTDTPEDVS